MKIGLYGGTFDPIHCAHLIISQYIIEELQLEKVIFIPAAHPPHKETFAAPQLRLQMVYDAIRDNPRFECSEFEIHQSEKTYSVDTIRALKNELGIAREDLYWIMGSDNFLTFDTWKEPEEICRLSRLVVFPRNPQDFQRTPHTFREGAVYIENAPIIDISSTFVRRLLREGRSIHHMVPLQVEELIYQNHLYV